jgi:photosystem II stability/assembly factor-like uncharacterized protein
MTTRTGCRSSRTARYDFERMFRATGGWHLAAAVLLSVATAACGESGGALPVAEPVAATDSLPASSDAGTVVATTPPADTTAIATISVPAATTPQDLSGEWVNATDGLVGLPSECGNLSLVSARPDRDMLIASVALQGLWASTDGSDSWTPLGSDARSAKITNRGSAIVFDPDHPDTFWESGIYNGGGVYRTDDNGLTFTQLGDLTHVDSVAVDLTDPARNTLVATIHERPFVYRSTNGGKTWTDLSSALPLGLGAATTALVLDAQTFLVGTSFGTASKLLITTDAGETWTIAYDAGVRRWPVVAKATGQISWLLEQSNAIITSVDQGRSWSLVTMESEFVPTTTDLVELGDGSLAGISNDTVVISRDQGVSWTPVGPPMPIIPMGMVFAPFRDALYVWHFDCNKTDPNPIVSDSIIRLDLNGTTG